MKKNSLISAGASSKPGNCLLSIRIGLMMILLLPFLSVSAEYRGVVFNDLNRNRQHDAGEKGMSGVAVSDGLNVVLTDKSGTFRLPGINETKFIRITPPAGYRSSGNFYLKAESRESGYDFGLVPFRTSENKTVRHLQLTDTETGTDYGWIGPIRDYSANEDISFIIHTGDICYEYGLNFHGSNVTSETMGVPVYYCIGNHDLVKGNYGEELYEKNFGPVYYSFDAGNTHFIVTPMLTGDYQPSYTKEDVYRWIKNDLRLVDPSKNLVVFNHNLLTLGDEFIYGINETEKINLGDHNLKAWIYGHRHSNYLIHHGNSGIVSYCSAPPNKGGIDHSVSNFPVYEIDGDGNISVRPRYNFLVNHLTILSPSGSQTLVDETGQLLISVNTYSTASPTETVAFKVEGAKKWTTLQSQTDWNWTGKIGVHNMRRGVPYTIHFRVQLKNGNSYSSVRSFVIPPVDPVGADSDNPSGDPLHLKWIVNAGSGAGISAPVYSEGVLYIAVYEDYGTGNKILAFDAATGKMIWQHLTENPVKNTISVSDGSVYSTDQRGIAYAINARSGELAWKRDLGVGNLPLPVNGGVVHKGVYYCGYGNYLSALDCNDGRLIWKNASWNGGVGTVSTMIVSGNTLIAGSNWQALYGHDLQSGAKKWEVASDGIRYCNGTATCVGDTLFFAAERALIRMNPATGELYKVNPVPYDMQVASAPLVNDRMIVTGTSAEGLVAWDRFTSEELWKVKPGTSLVYTAPYSKPPASTVESSPLAVGQMIIFGASDGYLYSLDRDNGRIMDKINLGAPVFSTACLAGNLLYVADFSGNISCFNLNN
ncbi:MAG: PQQ-binding-like beta-propeller repeat protein [Bacteroidales bacterium]|nr:PQQ-binding-like beta-propeller repeat protein [Bacteroidales bacterium]